MMVGSRHLRDPDIREERTVDVVPSGSKGARRPPSWAFRPLLLFGVATVAIPSAAEAQNLAVGTAIVVADVENREPVDPAEAFPADIGEVSFYTVVEGDFGERVVEHVWLWNGDEVARVSLTVRGPRWRTWSSKTIPADWTGAWEARIEDSSGTVLASVPFRIGG